MKQEIKSEIPFYRKGWSWVLLYLLFISVLFAYRVIANPYRIGISNFYELSLFILVTLLVVFIFVPFGILIGIKELFPRIPLSSLKILISLTFILFYAISIYGMIRIKKSKKWIFWAMLLSIIWLLSIIGLSIWDPSIL